MKIALILLISVVILVLLVVLATYLYGIYKFNQIKNKIGEKAEGVVTDVFVKLVDEAKKHQKNFGNKE
jgi:hypothetical protein